MSRFTSKQQLIDEITKERAKLDELLQSIPDAKKEIEVIDGMSVKDFIAHRAEWGEMMIRWYDEARAGKAPAVPTEAFKWNQLKELNADIYQRHQNEPLDTVMAKFNTVHDTLFTMITDMSEQELFEKKFYSFTGVSDLATYVNSATASHYRSARRHIQKWWRRQS